MTFAHLALAPTRHQHGNSTMGSGVLVRLVVAATLLLAGSGLAAAQTITAAWDANTDPYTAGYRLYYGTAPGAYSTNIDVGNVVSRQVTLPPGATYYFVVRAYNASQQLGPASAEVALSLATPAPTAAITATLGANNVATVSWQTANATAAAINGQPVALSGTAQYPVTTSTTFQLVATGAGGTATASAAVTVPVVDCVTSAWLFQSATAWSACTNGQRSRTETWTRTIVTPPSGGGAACGPLSEQRVVTQACTTPTPAPTAVISAALAGSVATVTWQTSNATTATINGQAVALSGTAPYPVSATTTFQLVATGPGGTRTASATVTLPVVDCVVSAWQFDSATPWGACTGGQRTRTETWRRTVLTPPSGGGAACGPLEEQRVAAQACTTEAPVAPGAPANPRARVSGSQVTLTWDVPLEGGAPTGYRVWVGTTSGAADVLDGGPVGNVLAATGSLPRGRYFARVGAYNDVGPGPHSAEVGFRIGAQLRPGRPAGFTAALEDDVAVLAWQEPAGDEADAPTSYVVEAGTGPGLANLARVVVGRATSFQARVPRGTYYVRVRAMNAVGLSEPSDEVVLRHVAEVGAPTSLTEAGDGSMVDLRWQRPSTGAMPAGFLIEAGTAPGLANIAVLRVGDVTTFTTTAPPGTYYVRVRAVAADGAAGPASNEVVVRR